MRYDKGHKELTRRRIVETAAARFRRDGIEGVGVADLMAEAGLTHGGFYSHFRSKEALVQAALEEAADRSRERFQKKAAEGGLEHWIRTYLIPEHRDHPERGCYVAALTSDIRHRPKATKAVFTERMRQGYDRIAALLPPSLPAGRRRETAIGVFAMVMGALQMSRAVSDAALSEEILESGITSALRLAELTS